MRTIWKFPLDFTRRGFLSGTVEMPRGAVIMHFAIQYRGRMDNGPRQGVPTVWAEVDDTQPTESARFEIVGTGREIHPGAAYVGTFDAEPHVWHVLDMRRAVAIPENLRPMLPDFPAQNAYRLLIKEGFTLGAIPGGGWYWKAPGDEPLTAEQVEAIGELQQHGFGSVV